MVLQSYKTEKSKIFKTINFLFFSLPLENATMTKYINKNKVTWLCNYNYLVLIEFKNLGFKRKEHLRNHLNYLHSNNSYNCSSCKKIFKRPENVTRHIKSFHSENSKIVFKKIEDTKNRPKPVHQQTQTD